MRGYRKTIAGRAQTKLTDRKKRLKYYYKISLEQERDILINQNNQCAICFVDIVESNKAIDHNHKTGIVRGILCRLCNQAIGMLKESKPIMLSAIAYIEKDKSNGQISCIDGLRAYWREEPCSRGITKIY